MQFFELHPEVAGSVGPRSRIDGSVHPPVVTRLHYEFDGWSGGELLESFPCFIVTSSLKSSIIESGCCSVRFEDVETSASDQLLEVFPEIAAALPTFHWLQVTGVAGVDDFGLTEAALLVVSKAALDVLRQHELSDCEVKHFTV